MARELFIYWKLPRAQLPQALMAAHALQAVLRERHPGLRARLLQRADETGDSATLMETYAAGEAGIDATLQRDIEALAAQQLGPWCAAGRHVEAFEVSSR